MSRRIIRRSPKSPNASQIKFNRFRRRAFFTAIKDRIPATRACELVGISFVTYRKWMLLGNEKGHPIQRRFRQKVKSIEVDNEKECLEIIRRAGKGGNKVVETKITIGPKGQETTRHWKTALPQWQAAAWWLERRLKDEYSKDISTEDKKKSAEELAREVKDALEALQGSVPTEEPELVLPDDMPD